MLSSVASTMSSLVPKHDAPKDVDHAIVGNSRQVRCEARGRSASPQTKSDADCETPSKVSVVFGTKRTKPLLCRCNFSVRTIKACNNCSFNSNRVTRSVIQNR